MEKLDTLITARFDRSALGPIADRLGEVDYTGFGETSKRLTEGELVEALVGKSLLISEFEPVTERVLSACEELKLIVCCRTGPEASVDIEAASRRRIPVIYTPGRNAISVAEFTLGLILAVARHIAEVHHLLKYTEELTKVTYEDKPDVRRGVTSEWSLDPAAPFNNFQGPELYGKLLGIVGFGAIGREVATRARAFGMRVQIFDPYVSAERAAAEQVMAVSLDELAEDSDFLMMAAKVTEETRGLVSQSLLERMKPTAYLINTARAALVDYDALYRVLSAGRIAGAALDVYPEEPMPADSPLRGLSNVVLTPHLAGASVDIPRHHSRMAVEAVGAALSGQRPVHLANPESWEHSAFGSARRPQ